MSSGVLMLHRFTITITVTVTITVSAACSVLMCLFGSQLVGTDGRAE